MEQIAQLLSQSLQLGPVRRQAELGLQQNENVPGFLLILLQLVGNESIPNEIRLAGSILFKNQIRKNWSQFEENIINENDRLTIKSEIVPCMIALSSRPPLQVQLGEAVSIIAEHDFPLKWENLIDQLISALTPSDYSINNGVLTTAHSIFKRWRSQFRSDELFKEIIFVLERFCEPYLQMFRRTDFLLCEPTFKALPLPQKLQLSQSMILLTQIYLDLNSQDLPPFFEDNNHEFMTYFAKYLVDWGNDIKFNDSDDDDEPTPLEIIRASICEIVELYSQRYLDAFPQMGAFVERVWTLVINLDSSTKYDLLIAKALRFLSTVVRNPDQRQAIENEATLNQFCEKIILPNMQMRNNEEEMFEDDPLEYIRRDLEPTTESDTRRSAATEFTRALMEQFETSITSLIQNYIELCLQQFNLNQTENWKSKDTAIYLLTSIASRSSTSSHGVSNTNKLIDVISFFSNNVFQHLQSPSHPILEVDAIKFLYTFRNQLSKEQILSVLPLLIRHLNSENYVVYSYASITIERTLSIKRNNEELINKVDIKPFAKEILIAIFNKIDQAQTPEKKAENEYLARAAMRIILVAKDELMDVYKDILDYLVKITTEISKNPSNPKFSQYIFESIAGLIKYTNKENLGEIEKELIFGPFQLILSQDVQEFQPFVFQIISQLLELNDSTAQLPDLYKPILPPLMQPQLWEQRGNVPPLVRLLKAFLLRSSKEIVENNQLNNILGVFQKLINSKVKDVFGFEILESLFSNINKDGLDQFTQPILNLLLTRLQASKTDQFTRSFITFLMLICTLQENGYGTTYLINSFEKLQPGIFSQVFQSILLPEVQKISQRNKKIVIFGLIEVINDDLIINHFDQIFLLTIEAILKLNFDSEDLKAKGGNEILVDDEDELNYQTTYSRLASSEVKVGNKFDNVNLKLHLSNVLQNVSNKYPQKFQQLPQNVLQSLQTIIN